MNAKVLDKIADLLDDMATHNIKLKEQLEVLPPFQVSDGLLLLELKKHTEDYYKKLKGIFYDLNNFKDN